MADKVSDDIGFDEWSVRVEEGNSGEYSNVQEDDDGTSATTANSWLPAYGFHQTSSYMQDKQLDFYANDDVVDNTCGSHLLLETIMEETSDDLRSETSGSEHTSGLQTDSPASTVIHVPIHNGLTDKKSLSWNGLEINNDPGVQDDDDITDDTEDDDEDDDTESTSSDDNCPFPSRSSSLLQFEHLEKHYENVFRTQRTSSDPLRVGTSSFDKMEEKFGTRRRWNYVRNSQPDKLDRDIDDDNVDEEDEEDDDTSSMSSSSCSSSSSSVLSSDDVMSSSYCSMRTDSLLKTHVKSLSRSIDSLTLFIHQKQEKMDLTRSAELSQSLNDGLCKDDEELNDIPTTTGNLYRTVDCLSEIPVEVKNKSEEEDEKSKCNRTRSMENLSEDSGFGDHVLCGVNSSLGNLVKNTTPVDERDDIKIDVIKMKEEEEERYINNDSIYRSDSIWQSDPNLLVEACLEQFNTTSSKCVSSSYDHHQEIDNMESRFSVVSTPNLYQKDEDYHYRGSELDNTNDSAISLPRAISLKRIINFGSENILSNSSSKGSNIQITTSFVNLTANPLGGSNRGVHFCPVVSEVSWQEHYTSSEEEESSKSEEEEGDENEYEDLEDDILKETEMFLKKEIEANERERLEGVERTKREERCPSGTPIDELVDRLLSDTPKEKQEKQAAYDKEKEKYLQRNRLDLINSPPPGHHDDRGVAHVTNKPTTNDYDQQQQVNNQSSSRSVVVNDRNHKNNIMDTKREKKSSKLGEFFQRFSLKRLSGRTKKNKNESKPPIVVSYLKKDEKGLKNEMKEEGEFERARKPPLPPSMPPRRRTSDQVELASSSSYCAQSSQSVRSYNTPTMARKSPVIDPRSSNSVLLETDIDSNITSSNSGSSNCSSNNNKKSRSLLNLDNGRSSGKQLLLPKELNHTSSSSTSHHTPTDYRAKSMEFLLDKDNKAAAKPPENELQKVGVERKMSEHEIRVQRSLQKLNVPEWYKNSSVPAQGFLLKRSNEQGSPQNRWNSSVSPPPNKTTSLSSLASSTLSSAPRSPTAGVISSPSPTHYTFSRWSTSRLNSGTNSSSTSPCGSARSSFNYRQPYLGWRSQERLSKPRTPAERLAAGIVPQNQAYSSEHSTPSLNDVRCSIKEVTSAIVHYVSKKEEDSGIDRLTSSPRYTSDSKNSSPKGSTGRLCWLESSFVGTRPSDSSVSSPPSSNKPKTKDEFHLNFPSSCTSNRTKCNGNQVQDVDGGSIVENSNSNNNSHNESTKNVETMNDATKSSYRCSSNNDTAATLDDILDSLLGFSCKSRTPSPSSQNTINNYYSTTIPSASIYFQDKSTTHDVNTDTAGIEEEKIKFRNKDEDNIKNDEKMERRRSDGYQLSSLSFNKNENIGSDPGKLNHIISSSTTTVVSRPVIVCQNPKCNKSSDFSEAKRFYKVCHNCDYIYCSRECRRNHWEKHRKVCLHSRVGELCRKILSKIKTDEEILLKASVTARKGFITQGRGCAKFFFSSKENAEQFVAGMIENIEGNFIKWPDLVEDEMGSALYRELVRLCKSYNPNTRLVIYVAVHVISEIPTTGAVVKWERQIISRCTKTRLSSALKLKNPSLCCEDDETAGQHQTLILTSLPGCDKSIDGKNREITFTNIQRHLRYRGVSLRKQYPNIYKKLCAYVEGSEKSFTPVTIYPTDSKTGKTFMCIIMPDAEPIEVSVLQLRNRNTQTIDVGKL